MHLLAAGSFTIIFKNTFFNRKHLEKTDLFSVYNSKQRKTKKFIMAFDQYQDYFFCFETQNINTPHEMFNSFIPIITETTNMEMLKKMYLVPVLECTC